MIIGCGLGRNQVYRFPGGVLVVIGSGVPGVDIRGNCDSVVIIQLEADMHCNDVLGHRQLVRLRVAGDLAGSLEAQFKMNPVRLSMDGASFPVAAKDMANLRGRNIGLPYTPNLATPEGPVLDRIKAEMEKAGLI